MAQERLVLSRARQGIMALELSSDQAEHHWLFRGVCNSDCALIYPGVSVLQNTEFVFFKKSYSACHFCLLVWFWCFCLFVFDDMSYYKNLRFLKEEILKPLPLL